MPAAATTTGAASPSFDGLLAVIVVLLVVGLVMVLSSSSVQALRVNGSAWYYFERQMMWVGLGGIAMAVCTRLDYRIWKRLAVPLLAGTGVLLFLVLVPGFGISVNGSTRWLGVGQWRIQPSELAKFALLVTTAVILTRHPDDVDDPRRSIRPVTAVAVPIFLLVMLQPDMGTTLVTGAIVLALLFVAGVPGLKMAKLVGWAAGGSLVLGIVEPYRRDRFLGFLHPWKDPMGIGYQTIQGRIALAEGRLAGVGLGASRAKWGFLPNAHTDFIFAIIGDEVGLAGTVGVVALFVAFAVFGVRAALRAPDRFGALLAAGITTWVTVQAFINIGAVIGILPITGVPLPFVSFGGSSLVLLMGVVGILLNIARQERVPRTS
jgi:cell division protein FtsW